MAYSVLGGAKVLLDIVETRTFTRRIPDVLDDDEYRKLQAIVASAPTIFDVIPGSGGIRKIRWGLEGRGKRSGARVFFYHAPQRSQVLMLAIFAKNDQDDLRPDQLKILRRIVEEEYR